MGKQYRGCESVVPAGECDEWLYRYLVVGGGGSLGRTGVQLIRGRLPGPLLLCLVSVTVPCAEQAWLGVSGPSDTPKTLVNSTIAGGSAIHPEAPSTTSPLPASAIAPSPSSGGSSKQHSGAATISSGPSPASTALACLRDTGKAGDHPETRPATCLRTAHE